MEATVNLSRTHSISPFELFKQDAEDVIMLLNFYIEKSEETPQAGNEGRKTTAKQSDKPVRVRVTDATATGGWY